MKRKLILRASVLLLTLAVLLPSIFAATEMIADAALTIEEAMVERTGSMSLVSGAPATISGAILKNVPVEALCSEVVSYFGSDSSCFVIDTNGDKITTKTRVGSGYIVSDGIDSYTIAVKGDIDGDTYVTGKDVVRAKKLIEGGNYTELQEAVLDYNGDGIVNASDVNAISNYANTADPALSMKDQEPVNLGDDFYANINSGLTGYSLTIHLDENAIIYESKPKDPQQIWHFVRHADGTYRIENLAFGKSLDVSYGRNLSGSNVNVYDNHNDPNQKWGIYPHTDADGNVDGYVLHPMCAVDRVLDVKGAITENETNVQIYDYNNSTAQKFYINKVDFDPSADYFEQVDPISYDTTFYGRLVFGATSLAVGYDHSDTTNVCVKTNSSASYQTWKFENIGSSLYVITSLYAGKVIDVVNGTMANSTNIRVYANNDTTAQRWYMYYKDGRIVLRSAKDPTYVIDVTSGKDVNNQNVQLYQYNGSSAQSFKFAGFTTSMPTYRVTCPYNSTVFGTYSSFEEAKAYADSKVQYGYVVFDTSGQVVYNPAPTLAAAKIVWNAKITADYIRDNAYTYGDAKGNPYYNRSEKVVSCDRFVGFALANAGYLANQPATRGTTLFGTNNDLGTGSLENFCISHGFVKITDINQVKAGDIIFVGYSTNDMGLAAQYRHYPKHVFIAASGYTEGGGVTYRYDAGNLTRIRSTQPSREALSTSNNQFRFAYRATK